MSLWDLVTLILFSRLLGSFVSTVINKTENAIFTPTQPAQQTACTHCPKLTGAAAPVAPTLTRALVVYANAKQR